MAGFYPDEWIEELRNRLNIVDIVSGYVRLERKGRRYTGLCPFHSERTPSFTVDADKQFYYCFGCHAGGDIFNFVMNIENQTFVEAVEFLAERAGMEPPETDGKKADTAAKEFKQCVYAALREAAKFYFGQLASKNGAKAREYLASRGISADAVKKFGLGYSPDLGTELTKHLRAKGFTVEQIKAAGLCSEKNSRVYDFFRGRIMYPVIDQRNRVLGFGARLLFGNGPKYINTQETLVYNKRNMLYGINLNKSFGSNELILVEGYMDMIAVSLAGFPNVVASLGTALTPGQARLARRYAQTVLFCYDADSAGVTAMLRGADIMAEEGLEVRIVQLPDCKDPDEYIKKHGKEAFGRALAASLTVTEFRLSVLKRSYDLSKEDGRAKYASEAALIAAQCSPVEAERYYSLISSETGYSFEAVKRQGEQLKSAKTNTIYFKRNNMTESIGEIQGNIYAERLFLALLAAGDGTQLTQMLKPEDFCGSLESEIFKIIKQNGGKVDVPKIIGSFENGKSAQVAAVFAQDVKGLTCEALIDLAAKIKTESLKRQTDMLVAESEEAAPERKKEIAKLVSELNKEIDSIKKGIHLRGLIND